MKYAMTASKACYLQYAEAFHFPFHEDGDGQVIMYAACHETFFFLPTSTPRQTRSGGRRHTPCP
jgi:hypothetical protein